MTHPVFSFLLLCAVFLCGRSNKLTFVVFVCFVLSKWVDCEYPQGEAVRSGRSVPVYITKHNHGCLKSTEVWTLQGMCMRQCTVLARVKNMFKWIIIRCVCSPAIKARTLKKTLAWLVYAYMRMRSNSTDMWLCMDICVKNVSNYLIIEDDMVAIQETVKMPRGHYWRDTLNSTVISSDGVLVLDI